MVVRGSGPPLVLIPGIQGRWQWMRPAVAALSRRFRVITFSLAGGRQPSGQPAGPDRFDAQIDQVVRAMDEAGTDRAVVCGVSYGGLVAVRLAATHPSRVAALVLVSTPAPDWRPDGRVRRYAGSPWRSAPAFFLGARERLWNEIRAARPGAFERWQTLARYFGEIVTHPPSPSAMAERVRAIDGCDFVADAKAVSAPTLVITGEAGLDRVVPVAGTGEYLSLIPGARRVTLERTGHIGLVTRPEEFSAAIHGFVQEVSSEARLRPSSMPDTAPR